MILKFQLDLMLMLDGIVEGSKHYTILIVYIFEVLFSIDNILYLHEIDSSKK